MSNWTVDEFFPIVELSPLKFSQQITTYSESAATPLKRTLSSVGDASFNEPHSLINFPSIPCICQCLHSSTICYRCLCICFPFSTFLSPLQHLINLYSAALSLNLLRCFPSLPLVYFFTFTSVRWCSLEETT